MTEIWLGKRLEQIIPIRVQALDQSKLLRPAPRLDLFLAGDRIVHRRVQLIPDEHLASIFGREALHQTFSVLECTSWQVRCHAGIDCSIAPAYDNIDAGLLHGVGIFSRAFSSITS